MNYVVSKCSPLFKSSSIASYSFSVKLYLLKDIILHTAIIPGIIEYIICIPFNVFTVCATFASYPTNANTYPHKAPPIALASFVLNII